MRDYLNTLLERSLGRLEVLQPRLPSRFEPVTPPAPLDFSEMGEIEGWEENVSREIKDHQGGEAAVRTFRPQASKPSSQPEDSASSPKHLLHYQNITPAGDVPRKNEPLVEQAERMLLKGKPRPLTAGLSLGPKLAPPPVGAGVIDTDKAVTHSNASFTPHSSHLPSQEEGKFEARTSITSSGRDDVLQAPIRTRPGATQSAFGLKPVQPPEQPFGPPRRMPPGFPEPVPTIQVTIGRLEVRAVPPAAPVKTPEPQKQTVMPLAEYLRQRGKGGAR